jgi:glycosyltransferase involved in cell wall biosynthesis
VRVALLVQGFSGYLDACFRALASTGVDLLIAAPRAMDDTEFDTTKFGDYAAVEWWSQPPDPTEFVARLDSFDPHVVLMGSWGWPPAYRAVMRSRKPEVLRILGMDNQWWATPKQWLGRATSRWYLRPLYDCVMVPSDRTEWFALRLGFAPENVLRGLYVADVDQFADEPRSGADLAGRQSFLFAGRLTEKKGVHVLAAAYERYRAEVRDPWRLRLAGTGPLASLLERIPGVELLGFAQPRNLAELMREASCFVLPTLYESYGVAVHEATLSALPVLVSHTAGCVPGLVQDGYNGFAVAAGDSGQWTRALKRMSLQPPERLEEMSRVSRALSTRLSPAGWARNFREEIELRAAKVVAT